MDVKQALSKASALCASSEKCAFDIKKKLIDWDVDPINLPTIIETLKQEKFIDHTRFATFFVRDKFKFNRWGRIKIQYELRQRGIETDIIHQALELINDHDYLQTLETLLATKLKTHKKTDKQLIKATLVRFGASRGFEPDLCFTVATKLLL